jgi:hypothetical protein
MMTLTWVVRVLRVGVKGWKVEVRVVELIVWVKELGDEEIAMEVEVNVILVFWMGFLLMFD